MVFHCPHSGQRPSHFGSSWPHAEQRYMSEGFFMVSLWYMRGRGGSIWPVGAIFFIPPRLSTILTDEFSVLRRILKLNKIKVRICIGTNCCFHGSEMLVDALENDADPGPFISGLMP